MDKLKRYKYEDALKDFKAAYQYSDNDYETLYELAWCYKKTGKEEKAKDYFFEIINNSGDHDLEIKAANFGLDMQIAPAKEAAAAYAAQKNGGAANAGTEEATTEKTE